MLNVTVDRNRLEGNFTCISNESIFDKRLTATAKSLLHMLIALPAEWKHNFEGWATMLDISGKALKKAVANLIEAGYAYCIQKRGTGGQYLKNEYYFYASPSMNPHTTHQHDERSKAIATLEEESTEIPEQRNFTGESKTGLPVTASRFPVEPLREDRQGKLYNTVIDNTEIRDKSVSQGETDGLPQEKKSELKNQLLEMSGFVFIAGQYKAFYQEAINRIVEMLSTGRINKTKSIEPEALWGKIQEINEAEKSLIPMMIKLQKEYDHALPNQKYENGRENYLKTVTAEFLMKYVPDAGNEEIQPERLTFQEILRQMNPGCAYCDDEELQSEADFAGYDDEDRDVRNCRIPDSFKDDLHALTEALKYLFCYSYHSRNEEYRNFSEAVITSLAESVCTGKISYIQPIDAYRVIDRLNEINSSREDSLMNWMQGFLMHYRTKTQEKLASGERIRNGYGFLKTLAVNYLLKDYHARDIPGLSYC